MRNKFIIIITCYNVENWLPINIHMNLYQSYDNFLCVYVDDKSTDNSEKIIRKYESDKLLYIKNENNGSQAKAYMCAIDYLEKNSLINNEDIIVEIDGDDWLSSVFVLEYLNVIYQQPNIWMTYGQYQKYPNGEMGGHSHMSFVNENHRNNPFPYSHLKTYKYWLFNKINRFDLIDTYTNQLFSAAWDHTLCLPMVEMAGKEHIHRCDDVLYILNRSDELENEGKERGNLQKEIEHRIRMQNAYTKLRENYISCDLLGPGNPGGTSNFGLGNMLFQIAAISSLAKDNDAIVVFPQVSESNYGNYNKSILNKVYTQTDRIFNTIPQSNFEYSELKYVPNAIYKGYFQSEKYFAHNREYIINLFKNKTIIKQIKNMYNGITNNSISLHIRRGDYVNLQDYHPLQTIEYYDNALTNIGSYETLYIFSDDIDWCKQNLHYNNSVFVEGNDDVFDLLAMSLCTNNIIANSTFSWWGAWLNENPNKKVIAPKKWFGNKKDINDNDIIPNSWIRI